jgi:hypothetical protein
MPRNAIGKFNRRGADKSDIRETLVEEEQTLIETLPERHTYTDAEIQQALDLNGGDIALAAEAVGCSEATIRFRGEENMDFGVVSSRRVNPAYKYTPEQMIVAITNARGNIQNAAVILGCARITIKQYVARFPQVREAYLDQHDQVTDIAQSRLVEAIDRGEPWALMFYYREYWPRYVEPIRGDSGRFPAILPLDESYGPNLDRLTDDQLTQLGELASVFAEDQADEG